MATGGVLGNGTKVGFSATSTVSYTKVAQLMDIPKFISLVANDIDTTVHSTSRVMTSMPGMIPVPEIQLQALADLDQSTTPSHETMRGYQVNGTTVWWRVEIPVDRTQTNFRAWEFQAYIKEYTPNATKIASAQTVNFVLKYAGSLTVYNAGASILG